ncbi:hypothetical protein C8R43DRAFT_1136711 [Mycena crocata]|nr:hypothetical protein C8R43DRAFT_1136711 [Mycena crocata]
MSLLQSQKSFSDGAPSLEEGSAPAANASPSDRFYHWLTEDQQFSPSWGKLIVTNNLYLRTLSSLLQEFSSALEEGKPFPVADIENIVIPNIVGLNQFFDIFVHLHHAECFYTDKSLPEKPFTNAPVVLALQQIFEASGIRYHGSCKSGMDGHASDALPEMGYIELSLVLFMYLKLRQCDDCDEQTAIDKVSQWIQSGIGKSRANMKDGDKLVWKFSLVGLKQGAGFGVLVQRWHELFTEFNGEDSSYLQSCDDDDDDDDVFTVVTVCGR